MRDRRKRSRSCVLRKKYEPMSSRAAQSPNHIMPPREPLNVFQPAQDFEALIDSVAKYHAPEEEQEIFEDVRRLTDYRVIGQIWNTYVIVECADRLYLIDQHAAHERINFERMKKGCHRGRRGSSEPPGSVHRDITGRRFFFAHQEHRAFAVSRF